MKGNSFMWEKIKSEKIYIKIVKHILKLIEKNKLKVGQKLPSEKFLQKEFGVSRSSIREALVALEVMGVIKNKRGNGNYIKKSVHHGLSNKLIKSIEEEESPFGLLEARKIIEPGIILLAIKRATDNDIKYLENILNEIEKSIEDNNFEKTISLGAEFHIQISKITHNEEIVKIMSFISKGLNDKIWLKLRKKSYENKGYYEKSFKEHSNIFNAIKNRNYKDARKSMNKHLLGIGKDLLNN